MSGMTGAPLRDLGLRGRLDVGLRPTHDVATPLRYPGGKSALSGLVSALVRAAVPHDCTYVEPYAGGAGVAVRLLRSGVASRVVINDLDPAVSNFWDHAVHDTPAMLARLASVDVTLDEFRRQRDVLRSDASSGLDRAFAYLFLNRTSRSGIAGGGPIGGLSQAGRYRLGCRFNRRALAGKIAFLGACRDRITVTGDDGAAVVRAHAGQPRTFVFADPPYVRKGSSLYLNALDRQGHARLASALKDHADCPWLLTYDESPLVYSLYAGLRGGRYSLRYSAREHVRATELMVFSDALAAAVEYRLPPVTRTAPRTRRR